MQAPPLACSKFVTQRKCCTKIFMWIYDLFSYKISHSNLPTKQTTKHTNCMAFTCHIKNYIQISISTPNLRTPQSLVTMTLPPYKFIRSVCQH